MTVVSNGDPRSLAKTVDIYVFISPNHGSGSMNNSKHNIQQNQQTEKEKTQPHFHAEVSKFTLQFSCSFSPQIAWHINILLLTASNLSNRSI